jgi:glycosyltransferase 2 family protein
MKNSRRLPRGLRLLAMPWFRKTAAVIVTGAALWLSFRGVDWKALGSSFSRVVWVWAAAAVVNQVFSVYALGWRWKLLLKPKADISMGNLFRVNMISQYWNIVLPARAGEVIRAVMVSKNFRVPGGFAAGTVALEKVFDLLVFVGLWLLVPVIFSLEGTLVRIPDAVLLACGAVVVGLVVFVVHPDLFRRIFHGIVRFFPEKLRQPAGRFFELGSESIRRLQNPGILALLVMMTLGLVGLQVLSNYFLFLAFGLGLSFWPALVVLLAIQVGNIPPSIPGKVGIFEYAVLLALSVFGIARGAALGYAVMLHVVAYAPKIILGFWFISGRGGYRRE